MVTPVPPASPEDIAEIENLVRHEVDRQLSAQRQVLSEAVGLATKIIGFAFVLLVGIFTVFGLTTWKDIKNETGELVKKQAEAMLTASDAETGVRVTLTNLMNRTVVASMLVRHERKENDKSSLSHADWTRLRTWIAGETLELQDFSDALEVLNFQEDDRKRVDARALAKMLEPNQEGPLKWIRDQPDKVESILSIFKHQSMAPKAIAIIRTNTYPDVIRIKAANYSREVGYKEGADALWEAYDSLAWGDVKSAVLNSAASLRPEHNGVDKAVEIILKGQPQPNSLAVAFDLLSTLSSASTQDQTKVDALCLRLANYLVEKGTRFYLLSSNESMRFLLGERLRTKSDAAQPAVLISLPNSGSKSAPAIPRMMTFAEFAKFKPIWELAAQTANAGQLEKLGILLATPFGFMSLSPFAPVQIGYFITDDNDAKFEVTEKSLPASVHRAGEVSNLYIAATRQNGALLVVWTDSSGAPHTGVLKAIKGTKLKIVPRPIS